MRRRKQNNQSKKKEKRPLFEFDYAVIIAVIGAVFLIVVIMNKTFELSIPIFGKDLDSIGINWTIYVKKNLFWLVVSLLMLIGGITRAVVYIVTLNNKIRDDELKNPKSPSVSSPFLVRS